MLKDLIPIKFIPKIRRLGYRGIPTFYKVSKWFRQNWGYTSWIEQTGSSFVYKIYSRNVYYLPISFKYDSHYCKTYEEAETKLIDELISIVEKREKYPYKQF